MHIKEISYITVLILIISSCKPSTKNLYIFDPRSINANKISLSDIADDISYLPLPNTFPVGNCSLFNFINQCVYFYSDQGIIGFNKVNEELIKIGNKGRGPGEYLFYSNFAIDKEKETVYVLDQGEIIKVYSKSGEFLRNFTLERFGSPPASIDFFESKLFVTYKIQFGNSKYIWSVFDTLGNLIKRRETGMPAFNSIYGNNYATYRLANRIYYWNAFTDTVFSVLPDLSEKPSFLLSPGEHRFPKSKNVPINPYEKYLVLISIFETNRFIIFRYYYKNSILLLYDKIERKSYKLDLEFEQNICVNGIKNDLDGGKMFVPEYYFWAAEGEYLVSLINPASIKSYVSGKEFLNSIPKLPEKKKELEKLATSLEETDNPVIVLVKLKK